MKVAFVLLLTIGAFATAETSLRAQKITADCVDDIIDVAVDLKPVVADITALVQSFSLDGLKPLFDDFLAVVKGIQAAIETCEASSLVETQFGLSGQCLEDIEAIGIDAAGIAEDIASLAHGDFGKISDIISKGEALISEIKTAKNDC